VLIN